MSRSYEDEQAHLIHCFAKYCWKRRKQRSPKGMAWGELFAKNHNEELTDYRTRIKGEEAHSK